MTSQATRQTPATGLRAIVAANLDQAIIRQEVLTGKRLTNRALGDRIGKTETQVWKWRTGRHMPGLETLAALADVLFDGDVSQFYVEPDKVAA